MNLVDQFLWVIYPYLAISVLLLGTIFRFNTDPYSVTAKSSEFLEKRLLKWGSLLFHIGIVFVFFGHVGGILVPVEFYKTFGIPDEQYHMVAVVMGSLAGAAAMIGLIILVFRRFFVSRIRVTSSLGDFIAVLMLLLVISAGMLTTLTNALDESGFDYRTNIGPWFRGIILFRPDAALMSQVPVIFKIHILAAFAFVATIPFTRVVHLFSIPITYLKRSYVVYRKKG